MARSMILLATALLVLPVGARADWQYTRWGMMPDEVRSAAGGKVANNPTVAAQSDASGEALLVSEHSEGVFDFRVYFLFDRRSKRLEGVSLELVDPRQGGMLYDQLKVQYGQPASLDSTPVMRVARWADRRNNNSIVWITQNFLHSKIRFSPLAGRGA